MSQAVQRWLKSACFQSKQILHHFNSLITSSSLGEEDMLINDSLYSGPVARIKVNGRLGETLAFMAHNLR